MEFILVGAISLISLVLNYKIYRRITATYPVGTVEETELVTALCCCCKIEPELDFEPQKKEVKEQSTQADYGAWQNRTNIPWVPSSPPQPPLKPVEKGPLARPDGFI